MDITVATEFLNTLNPLKLTYYANYWNTITPKSNIEKFKRWLFAYASVHTTWKSNVSLYNHLKDCNWIGNSTELKQRIIDSRAGLYNNRTRFLMQFTEKFWNNPAEFDYMNKESWLEYRDRIDKAILGLGRAKIAFAQEMINPINVRLLCTDVHILKLHGFTSGMVNVRGIKDADVDIIERNWVDICTRINVSPALARFIYWDGKQNKLTSRYWSHLLEEEILQDILNNDEQEYVTRINASKEAVA
ncbi:hypothetical protein ACFLQL_00495 [Verrucomicrobiota bacterium]